MRDGRVEGIASAKFKGSGAAAEASGFGIDLLSIDIIINIDINIDIDIDMFSTANLTFLLSILLFTLMQLCSALSDRKFPASSGGTPPPCSCGEAFSSDGKKKKSLSKNVVQSTSFLTDSK